MCYSTTDPNLLLSTSMNPNDLKSNCNTPQQGVSQLAERRGIVTEEGMIELGKRVEHFRKKCGIMQVNMAEKLRIAQTMVSRIERGEARLHGELIIQLAKIFGITSDELLGIKSDAAVNSSVPRRWVKRVGKIDEMPKRDQDALARIIDAFLSKQTSKAS